MWIVTENESIIMASTLQIKGGQEVETNQSVIDNPSNFSYIDNKIVSKKIEWHEPDWKYRINITKEQLGDLTLNYFDIVLSLNTEPINPRYDLGDKVMVYINNITSEGQAVLDAMDIKVKSNLD